MLIPLFASVAPFLVWPLELVFPYPYLVEELVKGFLVFYILKSGDKSTRIKLTILAGFFFAFSESIMYLSNIFLVGTFWTFAERILLTTPLHIVTMLIMLFSGTKKRALLPLGIIAAMLVHYFFNLFAGKL